MSADTVTHRAAPGWWPNLVILSCSRCGWERTLDLNDARWTARSYVARESAAHADQCEATS